MSKRYLITIFVAVGVLCLGYVFRDAEHPSPLLTGLDRFIISTPGPVVEPNQPTSTSIPDEPEELDESVIDKHCLSLAIYGEARGETAEGMAAVAWVIRNRVDNKRFPNSICEVVLQLWQFESLNPGKPLRIAAEQTQDGVFEFPSMKNKWVENKIQEIAEQVYNGTLPDPTHGSTHFWSPKVQAKLGRNPPAWSQQLKHLRNIGNHRFYKQG